MPVLSTYARKSKQSGAIMATKQTHQRPVTKKPFERPIIMSPLDLLVANAVKLVEYYGATLDEHHTTSQKSLTKRYEAHGLAILYEESRIRAGVLGTMGITVTLGNDIVLDAYFILSENSEKMIVPAYSPGDWEKALSSGALPQRTAA